MAVITTQYVTNNNYALRLTVTQGVQSITNNSTTIKYKIEMLGPKNYWVYAQNIRAYINGTNVFTQNPRIKVYSGILKEGSITIKHNTDGKKTILFNIQGEIYSYDITRKASGSLTLTDIPRKAYIRWASDRSEWQTPELSIKNPGGATLTLRIYVNGTLISTRSLGTHEGYYRNTWTTSEREEMFKACKNTKDTTLKYQLTSIIGSNSWVDTVNKRMKFVESNPKFEDFIIHFELKTRYSWQEFGTDIVTTNSAFAKIGFINIRLQNVYVSPPEAKNFAEIDRYEVIIEKKKYIVKNEEVVGDDGYVEENPFLINHQFSQPGTYPITVTCIDSRGNKTQIKKNVQVYNYKEPSVDIEIKRKNNYDDITYLNFKKINYDPIKYTSAYSLDSIREWRENKILNDTIRYNYGYIDEITQEIVYEESEIMYELELNKDLNGKYTVSNNLILNLDKNKKWIIEISIEDDFSYVNQTFVLDKGRTIFRIGTDKKAYVDEKELATIEKIYPIGAIYISVNNVNPSTYFGGTWVSFGAGRTLVGVDTGQTEFNSVQKTGGAKTHTLTQDEMPSHRHRLYGAYSNESGTSNWATFSQGSPSSRGTSSPGWMRENVIYPTGGGQAHNNLQPYITVYMWRRTA